MYHYALKPRALKQLKKFPKDVQIRIISKLDYYVGQPTPLVFAEKLTNFDLGSYRFRVGDYRIVFDMEEDSIVVLAVGHRRDIYK